MLSAQCNHLRHVPCPVRRRSNFSSGSGGLQSFLSGEPRAQRRVHLSLELHLTFEPFILCIVCSDFIRNSECVDDPRHGIICELSLHLSNKLSAFSIQLLFLGSDLYRHLPHEVSEVFSAKRIKHCCLHPLTFSISCKLTNTFSFNFRGSSFTDSAGSIGRRLHDVDHLTCEVIHIRDFIISTAHASLLLPYSLLIKLSEIHHAPPKEVTSWMY